MLPDITKCPPRGMSKPSLLNSFTGEVRLFFCPMIVSAFMGIKIFPPGNGVMVQWLRAVVALADDRGPIPSTHMVTHSHLYVWFQRLQICVSNRHGHGTHTYM